MSLDNNSARVALGTFLAGAAVLFSGGEAALADGSTTKFSLPPVAQGKDRCIYILLNATFVHVFCRSLAGALCSCVVHERGGQ